MSISPSGAPKTAAISFQLTDRTGVEGEPQPAPDKTESSRASELDTKASQDSSTRPQDPSEFPFGPGTVTSAEQGEARSNPQNGIMEGKEDNNLASSMTPLAGPFTAQATVLASPSPSNILRPTISEPDTDEHIVVDILTNIVSDASTSTSTIDRYPNSSSHMNALSSPLSSILSIDLLELCANLNDSHNHDNDTIICAPVRDTYDDSNNNRSSADEVAHSHRGAVGGHDAAGGDANNVDDFDADAEAYPEEEEVMLLVEPTED